MRAYPSLLVILSLLICCDHDKSRDLSTGTTQDLCEYFSCARGGIVQGDTSAKSLALIFTGGDYADGGIIIKEALKNQKVKGSFFFTGDFYRNYEFAPIIRELTHEGHYLGAHSDRHLLYCDWNNRDSMLVTKEQFLTDLRDNYVEMATFGIFAKDAPFFLPPYEWYNDSISKWTAEAGFQLINFTPGTLSNADYTTPDMPSYRSSEEIYQSILRYDEVNATGLNGFLLLIHIGAAPQRIDKFYDKLEELVRWLKSKGYTLKRVDELLNRDELMK